MVYHILQGDFLTRLEIYLERETYFDIISEPPFINSASFMHGNPATMYKNEYIHGFLKNQTEMIDFTDLNYIRGLFPDDSNRIFANLRNVRNLHK